MSLSKVRKFLRRRARKDEGIDYSRWNSYVYNRVTGKWIWIRSFDTFEIGMSLMIEWQLKEPEKIYRLSAPQTIKNPK